MRWLTGQRCDVVDLGAGTGKLTRALVRLGHRVTPSSPLPEMLELLPATSGRLRDSRQRGGHSGPGWFPDVVTSAQSFHWFEHAVALPEIARVLSPGGRLALAGTCETIVSRGSASLESHRERGTGEKDVAKPIGKSGLFGPSRSRVPTEQCSIARRSSTSCSAQLLREASPGRARADPRRGRRGDDEVAGADGVGLPYVTECFGTSKLGKID